jgi:hypothetical protein
VCYVLDFSTAGTLGLNFAQVMDAHCLLHMYRPSDKPSTQSNTKSLEDSAFKMNSESEKDTGPIHNG